MLFGFPLRTRITNGVLLMIPFCGSSRQSWVTKPCSFSRCGSRSIEKIPICALTPCRIWLVIVSDPAKEAVKLTSTPCSLFHLDEKPGKISFSSDSFMMENPYSVMLTAPRDSIGLLGRQLLKPNKSTRTNASIRKGFPLGYIRVFLSFGHV